MEFVDDILELHDRTKARIAEQGTDLGLKNLQGRYDIIMYSAIPWIQYTHSVQVHHGLMDGLHVGRYFEELRRSLDLLTR